MQLHFRHLAGISNAADDLEAHTNLRSLTYALQPSTRENSGQGSTRRQALTFLREPIV